MERKITLVEPRGANVNVFSKYMKLPLLGPVILGTILKEAGYEVKIVNENILGREIEADELDCDDILISALTLSAPRAYQIAQKYRELNKNGRIIIGGIHPSFLPNEAIEFADHVVCGETENAILDLIRHGSNEKIIHVQAPKELDLLPIPDFSLLKLKKQFHTKAVMTSRGCPYNCSFCAVTKMFGRRYRTVSPQRVMEHLEDASNRYVFFYDDNFVANRSRTNELLDLMIKAGSPWLWTAQVRADVAKDAELVAKMRASGCHWVYVGFESINQEALESMNKAQDVETISQCIKAFHKAGIGVHGMFILGNDEDDISTAKRTLKFSRRYKLDTAQFMVLTPIPGTDFFNKLTAQKRILHTDWQYYDGHHVVFRPLQMSALELQKRMLWVFLKFYSVRAAIRDFTASVGLLLKKAVLGFQRQRFSFKLKASMLKLFGRRLVKKAKRLARPYVEYLKKLDKGSTDAVSN